MRLSWPLRSHSPPTCFRSWLGERSLLSFIAVDTGQTPKCGSLHFPFPFSSLKSWVISYQRTCEPCSASSNFLPSPHALRSSGVWALSCCVSLPSRLLSASPPECGGPTHSTQIILHLWVHPAKPLPFQHHGTRLWSSGTTGASNPGGGYPHLPPGAVCGSVFSPAKEAYLGDRVEMASFNTHHHRPLRRVYDFRPKTTRNIPRCVLHVLPKCEASISGQEAFPSVT